MSAAEGTPFSEGKGTAAIGHRPAFVNCSFIVAVREDFHDAVRAGQACQVAGLQVEIQDDWDDPSGIACAIHIYARSSVFCVTVRSAVVVDAVLRDGVVRSIRPKRDAPTIEGDDIVGADHVAAGLVNKNTEIVTQMDLTAGVRTDEVSCDGIVALGNAAKVNPRRLVANQ